MDFGKDRVAVLDDRSGEVTYNGNYILYYNREIMRPENIK